MADENLYRYRATVLRVIDGDTFDSQVQLGFGVTVQPSGRFDLGRFRLYGVDTPETTHRKPGLSEPEWIVEKQAGERSKVWLKALIEGKSVIVRTQKPDKYGRWLCWVWTKPEDYGVVEKSVNFQLLSQGLAKEYADEPLPKEIK